jgi:hypothetical protein
MINRAEPSRPEGAARRLVSRDMRHQAGPPLPCPKPQVAVSHILSHTACLISPLSPGSATAIFVTATTLGYARVSTTGQYLDAQLATLAAAGVDSERVFTDKLGIGKNSSAGSCRNAGLRPRR